jgi:hypothetical protein
MPKVKINTDRIVSLSAMAVGIGSLIVVLYQTHLMRQAQRASVLPYVMIALHSNNDGVAIVVSNAGVGPALIKDVQVEKSGQVTKGDAYDYYTALYSDSGRLSVDRMMPGRLVPAGSSAKVLEVSGDGPTRAAFLAKLLHTFDLAEVPRSWYTGVGATAPGKAVIVITYESVYGERWRVRSDRMVPEAVP